MRGEAIGVRRLSVGLALAFIFLLAWSSEAEPAYRLHFRNGSTVKVDSYQDNGDSISYSRFGGIIVVPKAELAVIENLQTGARTTIQEFLSQAERERQQKEQIQKLQEIDPGAKGSPAFSPGGELPSAGGSPRKDVSVRGYTRKDGTYVPPHTRSAPRSRR